MPVGLPQTLAMRVFPQLILKPNPVNKRLKGGGDKPGRGGRRGFDRATARVERFGFRPPGDDTMCAGRVDVQVPQKAVLGVNEKRSVDPASIVYAGMRIAKA